MSSVQASLSGVRYTIDAAAKVLFPHGYNDTGGSLIWPGEIKLVRIALSQVAASHPGLIRVCHCTDTNYKRVYSVTPTTPGAVNGTYNAFAASVTGLAAAGTNEAWVYDSTESPGLPPGAEFELNIAFPMGCAIFITSAAGTTSDISLTFEPLRSGYMSKKLLERGLL